MSAKHELGGRYIRQEKSTGMFVELQGRSSNITESYDRAQEGYRKITGLKVPSGESTSSFPGRQSDARLKFCERYGAEL